MKLITDLSSDNIKGLVVSVAIPSMLSQLVAVLYSVVDRIYIGNIAGVGETALAGAGVVGPIANMITAFALLVGIGGAPLISINMGANKYDRAKEVVSNGFVMLLGIGALVLLLAYPLKHWILMTFGASSVTYPYANDYFKIYLLGTFFQLLSVGLNQFIIAQGFSKNGMISVMLGAIVNIILDPIFIFVLGLGVKGAAIATVISQFCSCCYVLKFLTGDIAKVRLEIGKYNQYIVSHILRLGSSAAIIVLTDNLLIILLNTQLQKYGGANYGDILITCNTILQSFYLVIVMPLGGLTMGTASILGYNLGAKRGDKIKKAERVIFTIALMFCSIMFVVSWFYGEAFIRIFTKDPMYIDLTKRFMKYYTLGIIPLAIQYAVVDGFQGMGKIQYALPLSLFRKAFFMTCVFVLPMVYSIEYVFLAESLSDIIPAMITYTLYRMKIDTVIEQGCVATVK